jgi:hypothetical protein
MRTLALRNDLPRTSPNISPRSLRLCFETLSHFLGAGSVSRLTSLKAPSHRVKRIRRAPLGWSSTSGRRRRRRAATGAALRPCPAWRGTSRSGSRPAPGCCGPRTPSSPRSRPGPCRAGGGSGVSCRRRRSPAARRTEPTVDAGRVVGPARSRACRWSITSRCFRRECSIVARRARCVNGPKGALSRVYSPSWFRGESRVCSAGSRSRKGIKNPQVSTTVGQGDPGGPIGTRPVRRAGGRTECGGSTATCSTRSARSSEAAAPSRRGVGRWQPR